MLTYFVRDATIEMYDMKNRRPFLKRSEYAEVKLPDLYIGATVVVLARQLKLISYADEYTKKALDGLKCRTMGMVKPDGYNHIGYVISAARRAGFVIANMKMVKLGPREVEEFLSFQPDGEMSREDASNLQADNCLVMELVGDDAVSKWQQIVGPRSPSEAQRTAPRSLRAAFGSDEVRNGFHASANSHSAEREIELFFGRPWPSTAVFNHCTLCIIRPHAYASVGGEIVAQILEDKQVHSMNLSKGASCSIVRLGRIRNLCDAVVEYGQGHRGGVH
jgi:nucleoside-diphosphate kinase